MLDITGHFAPIVTPFTDDTNSVSEVRLTRLVRHLLDRKVDGFVCGTETGEFVTVSAAERKMVLEVLIREAHGVPVLAHCTRMGTAQSIDLCQHASRHGAKAAVIMPPYFGQYDDEEIEQHLRRILQHSGLPIIVVDPKHRVRTVMREKLQDLHGFHYAESTESSFWTRFAIDPAGMESDEFVCGKVVVSPLIQIDPDGSRDSNSDLRSVAKFLGAHGRIRTSKAALNARDVEVGPPRSPVLPLAFKDSQELSGLLQTD